MSSASRAGTGARGGVSGAAPPPRPRTPADPVLLAVIAAGGVLGSEARYGLQRLVAASPGSWPTATFVINVTGSLLLGALMVVLTKLTAPHRLLRPFLGVGVLGGYTTFSTAMVDVVALIRAGRPAAGGLYLVGTAVSALAAAALGGAAVRATAGRRAQRRRQQDGRRGGQGRAR